MDKGRSTLNATFNKNCFYNNETAEVSYSYDNSKTEYDVKSIDFSIK